MMRYALAAVSLLFTGSVVADAAAHESVYRGQESREIKSLSSQDIDELSRGAGWGLARAAELNGYPGPLHVLEMAEEIALSDVQRQQIQALFDAMNGKARTLGKALIDGERALDHAFAERHIDKSLLASLLADIEQVRSQLRQVHLAAHLETPIILTPEQIDQYNQLRGYDDAGRCEQVPAGHDPVMWRKHNDCE